MRDEDKIPESGPIPKSSELGFGRKFGTGSKRLINKDGTFNIRREGAGLFSLNFYQTLISMSWLSFIGVILAYYIGINLIFAAIYFAIGAEHLSGMESTSVMSQIMEAFYFSTQTLTTVGYGSLSPMGNAANIVASFEALIGLLSFALFSGLFYGRFSRPNAAILFSDSAVITPPDANGIRHVQFRIANKRKNQLIEMKAIVSLSLLKLGKESNTRQFEPLKLGTERVHFFPLNWTITHAIDQESPLYGFSAHDLATCDSELLILIQGFDDTFSQKVHVRSSYKFSEMKWDARFATAYYINDKGETVFQVDRLSDTEGGDFITHIAAREEAKISPETQIETRGQRGRG